MKVPERTSKEEYQEFIDETQQMHDDAIFWERETFRMRYLEHKINSIIDYLSENEKKGR